MYSVITQFAKLAAGEQLCRRRTHRKLQHFKIFKFSPEKSQILSCFTIVANERYVHLDVKILTISTPSPLLYMEIENMNAAYKHDQITS
jgi:hypothetical protein